MATYTLLNAQGVAFARNLSAPAAAHHLLTLDGRDYDILPRADDAGFVLWTIAPGGAFQPSTILSAENDEVLARDEIFAAVLIADRMVHDITVVDDAEYELWLSGFENE